MSLLVKLRKPSIETVSVGGIKCFELVYENETLPKIILALSFSVEDGLIHTPFGRDFGTGILSLRRFGFLY